MEVLLARCQRLREQISEQAPLALIAELRGVVADCALTPTIVEQLLTRSFATHLLARLARVTRLDRDPDICNGIVTLAAATWGGDEWFGCFARSAESFETVLIRQRDDVNGTDARVRRVLCFIESHFHESSLTLRDAALHAGLSDCYVARMMKRQTGCGFVAHLRRHRLAVARQLLSGTSRSVKEISAAVGYSSPRQLERDFKRTCSVSPVGYRRAAHTGSHQVNK